MVKIGCSIEGNLLNEAKFSDPLPWIGIYIASASLLCAILMSLDLIHGFRHQKLWFPSNFFSINATSLTLIAVAIKFSVDLNTAMPRRLDQLAKLSSSVLICTVMGNSIPSLGTMQNPEIMMNVIALGILVVTVVVNICIQLGTGVIYVFWREHAVVMFLMVVLLLILSFSALTLPITKRYLELKFRKKYEIAVREGEGGCGGEKLKADLMKFWMMAHTCSPQFVMARSVTCVASGALCLVGAVILAETILRTYLMPWSFEFCSGESDYKWSTVLVLVAQTVAVVVGTIPPAIRWFTAVNFRCPVRGKKHNRRVFVVEKYWVQCLLEFKECPLLRIQSQRCRKVVHGAKNWVLDLCIGVQKGNVLACKAIQFVSVFFVVRMLFLYDRCQKMFAYSNRSMSIDSESMPQSSSSKLDLSRFVLHLEGENELVELMMKDNRDATDHWMRKGEKKQPKHLIQLLEKSNYSKWFKGVFEFDSDLVPSLDSEEPPNCWSLPIVTLTAIAIALPNVSYHLREQLTRSVHEGLMYVKLIEDTLDQTGELINLKNAASVLWLGVDLYHKWLDVDLDKLSQQSKSAREILEGLADAAKNRFAEFKKTSMNQCLKEIPARWPIKLLAANTMFRVSKTALQIGGCRDNLTGEGLFDQITVTISDILGACLTNLHQVISFKCLCSSIEDREDSIRHAVFLLGEMQNILKLLDQKTRPCLNPDQLAFIDEWRSVHEPKKHHLALFPSSETSDADSSTSDNLYLTIE